MRRLVLVSMMATLVLGMLVGLAVRTGAAWVRPPNAVADLDSCPLPCWRGITPGETTLTDAQSLLLRQGYRAQPANRFFTNPVTYETNERAECFVRLAYGFGLIADVVLNDCPEVRLGDVMPTLGEPDGFVAPHILSFRGATVFVEIVGRRTCDTPFSPNTRVENIFIMPSSYPINQLTQVANLERLNPWRGFMAGAHYLALDRPGVCSQRG